MSTNKDLPVDKKGSRKTSSESQTMSSKVIREEDFDPKDVEDAQKLTGKDLKKRLKDLGYKGDVTSLVKPELVK